MKLRSLVLSAISLLALMIASAKAEAQETVDQGEFVSGDAGAAPNADSESVPGLRMEMPSYGGTGCPQGTAHATLSPDQRAISVLFDQYIAEAGGPGGATRVSLGCQLNIPFSVPPGYRVMVVKMDYRGFTSVPQGARSTFGAGYRYLEINGRATDARRVLRAKVFAGPVQENFEVSSILRGPHWSPCGKPFVLAAESYVNAQSNRAGDQVITTVDSLDAVQLPVIYSLRWQRCNDRMEPPGRPDRPGRPLPPPPRGGPRGPRPRYF